MAAHRSHSPSAPCCDSYRHALRLSRRGFLGALGALTLPALAPRLAFAMPPETAREVLVCIFLRGGWDGLNVVVPFGDSYYYDFRPTLAIREPGSGAGSALNLDGFFGFHPALAPLKELYDDGALAAIHAAGPTLSSHSHFDAMDYIERGTPGERLLSSGWLGRHLASTVTGGDTPFRALGVGGLVPASLRGPIPALALTSVEDFQLYGDEDGDGRFEHTLYDLYGGDTYLDVQARQTFRALESLAAATPGSYQPANGAQYPDTYFSMDLQQVAQVIKGDLGLEVACLDFGGWDTHEGQGGAQGYMADQLADLGASLAAFYTDLGERMANVTVVTTSEFGRRVEQNGTDGTDHGYATCMLALGGGIRGGRVLADWPGLDPDHLVEAGDLAVTTDYRNVLGEILSKRFGNTQLDQVFPGLVPHFPGLVRAV